MHGHQLQLIERPISSQLQPYGLGPIKQGRRLPRGQRCHMTLLLTVGNLGHAGGWGGKVQFRSYLRSMLGRGQAAIQIQTGNAPLWLLLGNGAAQTPERARSGSQRLVIARRGLWLHILCDDPELNRQFSRQQRLGQVQQPVTELVGGQMLVSKRCSSAAQVDYPDVMICRSHSRHDLLNRCVSRCSQDRTLVTLELRHQLLL